MRVAVIGAGVVGALVVRELARYEAEVLLFEQEADVGWGVTKANSGIVHAGFHDRPGTACARFCVSGNALFDEVCRDLDVPFRRTGAYVLALSAADRAVLDRLRAQGEENGVPGLEVLPGGEVLAREPNVNPAVVAALWAPTVGITEPWALALAAVENAAAGGLAVHLGEEVTGIRVDGGRVRAVQTARGSYPVDAVVNAAGLYADQVAAMAGVPEPRIVPRRGEYVLLDKAAGDLVRAVLFPTPSEKSKGILVLPTIDGGILLGPTAADLPEDAKEATDTSGDGLRAAVEGARRLVPKVDCGLAVKAFAGLRPESPPQDFVVGTTAVRGFYQAAAMRSPGLTAAPAVARWLVHEVIAGDLTLVRKASFDPVRRGPPRVADLASEEWEARVREDPRYGRIVCFCNLVTEGEIVDAIRRGARSLDGVKFRTRAGFGRCQGGFCTDRILAILARELGTEPEEVPLRDPRSWLVAGKIRP
ncbi:MAG: NAD(P)/FAD-dependent oxidoreductase [Candidatus Acetothermia bacterium]|jgi:glycerol-3-phosphate dehydrogenase|nr:NAD(P)/FAD-dependent oxidoreductase [Candidatus Acetothermia bacterium]